MREPTFISPVSAVSRPTRATQEGIPPTKAGRDRVLAAVRQYVAARRPTPPLSLDELREHSAAVRAAAGVEGAGSNFVAVLLNNEVWREQFAAVPYNRRLLLLPQCLRDADACEADLDEMGLICRGCGRCCIHDLQQQAERLGYVVLVAEGSPVVMSLIETNQVDALLGVSCLNVLERVFPYVHAAAVPGLAIPLLNDGCRDTDVDLDWVTDALHLTGDDRMRRVDLDALRRRVEHWFTPDALDELLGPASGQTERLARQWLARSGKRWRPFLAVCAYLAIRNRPDAELPRELRHLAVAVECFHKASLVHDDIEDDDDVRYDQPALHVQYGVPVALNVGDLLLGEGYRLIAECPAPAARQSEMLRIAADGHRTLCIGQGAELCWAREPAPLTPEEVLDIFRRKTAPAFHVALHLGALAAGAGEHVREVLSRYSEALGVAYQIRDDLDDFVDGADPPDAEALRPSILLAIAHQSARGAVRERIEALWRREVPYRDVAAELEGFFDEARVAERTRRLLEATKNQAIRALTTLDNPSLKGLLRRVITRIFTPTEVLFCCDDYQSELARRRGRRDGESA